MILSPVLPVLGGFQIVRRVAEYAVAKPTREMLFTVVDWDSRFEFGLEIGPAGGELQWLEMKPSEAQ